MKCVRFYSKRMLHNEFYLENIKRGIEKLSDERGLQHMISECECDINETTTQMTRGKRNEKKKKPKKRERKMRRNCFEWKLETVRPLYSMHDNKQFESKCKLMII